ncbi:MAG TPA: carboxypeptidase-like regulatory domain-containing protein, partial [Opitutaceae bacterium]|nr:carboxypeptidase-like regulatory domain-containing protein [Opitutaceae bacterium]
MCIEVMAQTSAAAGMVEGRVLNESSGNYLNNARVSIPGTTFETNTDITGFFRLRNLPAGSVTLQVSYVGLTTETMVVRVDSDAVVTQNFSLRLGETKGADSSERVHQLDALTVAERQLSGRASALQEQKNAPNIKNVIAFDEFGEMGEGNVAEYLKYVPGLDISYSPQIPLTMSIRGMPASGTLVTIDGAVGVTTLPGVTRNFDFSNTATANIDRVEVTKTPTPDLPANAVGGSINIITKSGFSQPKPLLRYNLFATDDELGGIDAYSPSMSKVPGSDSMTSKRSIQPSFNVSYVRPINDRFAATASVSYAARQMDWRYFTPTWDRVRLVQTSNAVNNVSVFRTNKSGSASLDWRVSPDDLFTFSFQKSDQVSHVRSNTFTVNLGAGAVGDGTYSLGAATGVGTLARSYTANTQDKVTTTYGLRYKHNGSLWKIDGLFSRARGTFESVPRGNIFTSITNTNSLNGNLILRMDNLTAIEHMRNP